MRVIDVKLVDRKGVIARVDVALGEHLELHGVYVRRSRGETIVEPPGVRAPWAESRWIAQAWWSPELGRSIREAVLERLAAEAGEAEIA